MSLSSTGGSDDGARGRRRVDDAEREAAVLLLREAVADGRLDLAELDDRVGAALGARTSAELAAVTGDLRRAPAVPGPASPALPRALLGRVERRGVWEVPEELAVVALLGGVHLDLRRARFATPEVRLTCRAVLGGIEVIVGPSTRVVVEGSGILGGFSGPSGLVAEQLNESSTTVRIGGRAIWGGVRVERKHL